MLFALAVTALVLPVMAMAATGVPVIAAIVALPMIMMMGADSIRIKLQIAC